MTAVEHLERQLCAGVRRRHRKGPPRLRSRRMTLVLTVVAVIAAAAVAVAASGVLTGSPVPNVGPKPDPRRGIGAPVTNSRVIVEAADPAGGLPWGLKVVKTTRDYRCLEIGRVSGTRLGVLGINGAFSDDDRFHPFPRGGGHSAGCVVPDAAGHAFHSAVFHGIDENASPKGCAPYPAATPVRMRGCPLAQLRDVYVGLLGPAVKSITYAAPRGRQVTLSIAAPAGAYLIVKPNPAKHKPSADLEFKAGPGPGITEIVYRNGTICHLAARRAAGHFQPCPLMGYVAPHPLRVNSEQIATPIHARFAPKPIVPAIVPQPYRSHAQREWKLVITFRARVAGDSHATYGIAARLHGAQECGSTLYGEPDHDVVAGDIVSETMYVPGTCHGTVTGEVVYAQNSADGTPALLPGSADAHDPVVGHFTATIPR